MEDWQKKRQAVLEQMGKSPSSSQQNGQGNSIDNWQQRRQQVLQQMNQQKKQTPPQKPPAPKQQNIFQKASSAIGNFLGGLNKQKPMTAQEKSTFTTNSQTISELQNYLKTNKFPDQIGAFDMKGASNSEKKAMTQTLISNIMEEQYRIQNRTPLNKAGYAVEDTMNAVVPGAAQEAVGAEQGAISIGKTLVKLVRNAGIGAGITAGIQTLEGKKINPRDILIGAVTGIGFGGVLERKQTRTSLYDVVSKAPQPDSMSVSTEKIINNFHEAINPKNNKMEEFAKAFDDLVARKERIDQAMQKATESQKVDLQKQSDYFQNQINATYKFAQVNYPELFTQAKEPFKITSPQDLIPFQKEAQKYTSAADFAETLGTTENARIGTLDSKTITPRDSVDQAVVDQKIASIKEGKTLDPVVIEKQPDGKLTTTDGSNTLTAYQQLGKDVPVLNPKGDIEGLVTIDKFYSDATKTAASDTGRPVSNKQQYSTQPPSQEPQKTPEAAVNNGRFKPEPIGEGKTQTSRLAQNVEASAIEKKLTEGFGDLPQYKTLSMKDQAQKAADLLSTDPQYAKDIAMGNENPPRGLLPESVFVAVEDQAIKNGDLQTIKDLATSSSLSTEATAMGQRIRSLGERNPDSPVSLIKKVSDERKAATQRKYKGKSVDKAVQNEVSKIKYEVKKKTPTKQTWEKFIDSITC